MLISYDELLARRYRSLSASCRGECVDDGFLPDQAVLRERGREAQLVGERSGALDDRTRAARSVALVGPWIPRDFQGPQPAANRNQRLMRTPNWRLVAGVRLHRRSPLTDYAVYEESPGCACSLLHPRLLQCVCMFGCSS